MTEADLDAAARKREYQRQWRLANQDRIREYYLANRDKILERQKADPDKIREYKRQWAAENPEKVRAARRRWREANPDKVQGQQARSRDYQRRYYETNRSKWRERHRARRHGIDSGTFMAMWEAQQRCCYLCSRDLNPDQAAVDHWHGCAAHDPQNSCRLCWRGLAHNECNGLIGLAGDAPDLLRVIADNLERANTDVAVRQSPPGSSR